MLNKKNILTVALLLLGASLQTGCVDGAGSAVGSLKPAFGVIEKK